VEKPKTLHGLRLLSRLRQYRISSRAEIRWRFVMPTIAVKDGTEIYYKDWGGAGQAIVFSHAWPLTADDWDAQMLFFGQYGYRVIAHDRRGHGRSSQPWDGHEMNTYADDLAALFESLDLTNAISAASSASRRIAQRCRLIVAADRERSSRNDRYRTTTERLKPSRGSEQYQAMNFPMACL
jgi:hypothetical protein